MDDELALRIAAALNSGGMIAYPQDDAHGMHVEIITGPDDFVCLFEGAHVHG